jgi:hypothetical protein
VYDELQVFLCAKRDMNLLWLNGDSRMRDGGGGAAAGGYRVKVLTMKQNLKSTQEGGIQEMVLSLTGGGKGSPCLVCIEGGVG